ncbi:MAG: hypothetical protein OXI33_14045 [Chloroflexota bacterium]|nr:hypothetical protein [Chloroflexota bacterium]
MLAVQNPPPTLQPCETAIGSRHWKRPDKVARWRKHLYACVPVVHNEKRVSPPDENAGCVPQFTRTLTPPSDRPQEPSIRTIHEDLAATCHAPEQKLPGAEPTDHATLTRSAIPNGPRITQITQRRDLSKDDFAVRADGARIYQPRIPGGSSVGVRLSTGNCSEDSQR